MDADIPDSAALMAANFDDAFGSDSDEAEPSGGAAPVEEKPKE